MIVAAVLVVALAMVVAERVVPGRSWPRVAGWWSRALALNLVQVASVFLGAVAWDRWFSTWRVWDAGGLGRVGGAIFGYVVITFVYYWWHRWRHEIGVLWRWLHQIHHSPRRIEIITSFYKHPFEIVVNGMLSSALLYLVCGLDPTTAADAVLLTGLAELFYHWNVPTPHWVGYVLQRPESHCIHHQEGVHHYNYADLPVWDMLFGTFRNPRRWHATCGFGAREERVLDMLRGVDVNAGSASGG